MTHAHSKQPETQGAQRTARPTSPPMPGSIEIWKLVEAEVDALPAADAVAPRVDLQAAAEVALHALDALTDDAALLARFHAVCATGELDGAVVTRAQRYAGAAWYARHRQLQVEAAATAGVVPEAVLTRADELYSRMHGLASYHFKDDSEFGAVVAAMNRAPGHRKMANQLLSLSEIYAQRAERVATDPVNYRATDQRDARKVAGEIIKALTEQGDAEAELWRARVSRVWSLLLRAYDETAALARWLLRAEPERAQTMFPSIFAEIRSAPVARKVETPANPAPVTDGSAVVAPARKKSRRR